MAATALLNPVSAYRGQPFTSPYHPPQSQLPPPPPTAMSTAAAAVISPPADNNSNKRPVNESESGARHTLPSISEVFSTAKHSPFSPSTPTTLAPSSQGLPPPFASAGPPPPPPPPRVEPGPPADSRSHEDRHYRYPSRPEPAPSTGSFSSYPEHRDPPSFMDTAPSNTQSNSHPPPPPPHSSYPPGQLPLSAAPPPPHGPPMPPYDPHRPPSHHDDEYARHRARYDTTLNRHFEAWSYEDCLTKVLYSARTICNFIEHYKLLASEQHGPHSIPERLPLEREVSDMIDTSIWMRHSLESMRDIVSHSLAEKLRDSRNKGPGYDGDDDLSIYGDGSKPPYNSFGEVKKRRGRAAPPGRCHSCNRIDTPEWRRGPDGARTLCNACGLHYAKLERKRQMENRSIRPKAVEERS